MDSPKPSSSSHRYPDWVMVDPYPRLNYPKPTLGHDYPEEVYHATNAYNETSKGDRIDVWFRAVPPPGASRLYVHWARHRRTKSSSSEEEEEERSGEDRRDRLQGRYAEVLAAHGNSIILELTRKRDRSDFFVYTARSTGPPSLFRLPWCDHKLIDGDLRSDHMVSPENIGLLCDGEREEFVVADLIIVPKYGDASHDDDTPVVAGLCVYRSSDPGDGWEASRPRILYKEGQGRELMWWHTDAVVPCEASLCYVDYYRGILFLDVLNRSPQLTYVRLPVNMTVGDPRDRPAIEACPESFRSVCVTDGGTMKFVDVVTRTAFVSGSRSAAASSFAINIWRLRQEDMTWEKETTMQDNELWALQGSGDLLRVSPEFPLVSMTEPDVVCFVLRNHGFRDAYVAWVIVVDMSKKTLRSAFRYNKVLRDRVENDGDMASASLVTNSPFIPCEFSKYLQVPAVATRKRSRNQLG